jgi:hypothetical protein
MVQWIEELLKSVKAVDFASMTARIVAGVTTFLRRMSTTMIPSAHVTKFAWIAAEVGTAISGMVAEHAA